MFDAVLHRIIKANPTVDSNVRPGQPAPVFTLPSAPGETISLNDFHGQALVLVFYPADWSPVCGDQLTLYNELLPEFQNYKAALLGISVDSTWSHQAYAESRNLSIPLLADFEPKGAVSKTYGVYNEKDGQAERALFVIDSDGIVRWKYVSDPGINPGAAGIFNALDNL